MNKVQLTPKEILVMAFTAAMIAMILMGIFGAVGIIVFPDFHFNLVGNLVCKEGTTFSQKAVQYDYHESDEFTFLIRCVTDEGVDTASDGAIFIAVFLILGGYFLLFFLISLVFQFRGKMVEKRLG